MSTEHLWEVLNDVAEESGEGKVRAARKELEAIEKAAVDITDMRHEDVAREPERWKSARATLAAIARQKEESK